MVIFVDIRTNISAGILFHQNKNCAERFVKVTRDIYTVKLRFVVYEVSEQPSYSI